MPVSHHAVNVARDLDAVFTVPRMQRVWKDAVRTGLRRQPLADLHDFLDVHRNLTPYLRTLRSEVLAGRYRPQPPEVTLLEKRDGIPRRLTLPAPADAILLQTVVTLLEASIAAGQPHPNAFYAKSHTPPGPEDVDGTFAYPWWLLWPDFQKRIWQFATQYNYVVVTDLANYFDCIPLLALRNRVASFGAFNETVLNFLFYLLDAFTWRPFYMPPSGVGLPQINFDAPRLLAHSYLFPVDAELQSRTSGDFVRWMDDINCGVPTQDAARRLLRGLEIVLNSLGIRLNAAKTKILEARDALRHFWVSENRSLTILTNLARTATRNSASWHAHLDKARREYRSFRRQERVGHWDKVAKRYLTLFGIFCDGGLESDVPELLSDSPSLRAAIFRYYLLLGPSRRRLEHISGFLRSGRCLDDASLFEAVRTLVSWPVRTTGQRRIAILSLVPIVQSLGSETPAGGQLTTAGVSAAIWLLAKYGSPIELAAFLQMSRPVWTRSAWAGRQAAAATPLLASADQLEVREGIVESGLTEALRVLASIGQLTRLSALDHQIRAYLLHRPAPGYPYPLEKAIIARVVLNARIPPGTKAYLRTQLRGVVSDPCCRAIIARRK
jgi:Reverse transcriptase (RNA-dependent DNA polymerase)